MHVSGGKVSLGTVERWLNHPAVREPVQWTPVKDARNKIYTGGDHLMGTFDVKSSVADGGSRQWKQIEQLKTIVIGLRLILGIWSSIVIRTFRMKWSVSLRALLEIRM